MKITRSHLRELIMEQGGTPGQQGAVIAILKRARIQMEKVTDKRGTFLLNTVIADVADDEMETLRRAVSVLKSLYERAQ